MCRVWAAGRLEDYLGQQRFAQATWGVQVETLRSGTVLFSTNGHRLLQPASSVKLLTAALALDQFGSAHRFVTTVHGEGKLDASGVLEGRLVVRGAGDFSWSGWFGAGRPDEVLGRMTQIVRGAGVRRIRGGIMGDTRLFRGPAWGAGWAWDDLQYGYGAGVSALMFRDGQVDLRLRPGDRIGSACVVDGPPGWAGLDVVNLAVTGDPSDPGKIFVDRQPTSGRLTLVGQLPLGGTPWSETLSVPEPARGFLRALRDELVAGGIGVAGGVEVVDWTRAHEVEAEFGEMRELGRIRSRLLGEMVEAMLSGSQNQYAQILLLQAGVARQKERTAREPNGSRWTSELGLEALAEFLDRLEVDRREVRLDEASGLARSDRISPAVLVRVLRAMARHREREVFLSGLRELILDTAVGDVRVRAKSGTMSDIYALAGYLEPPTGEPCVFSVMLNGFVPRRPGEGREAVLECLRLISSANAVETRGSRPAAVAR